MISLIFSCVLITKVHFGPPAIQCMHLHLTLLFIIIVLSETFSAERISSDDARILEVEMNNLEGNLRINVNEVLMVGFQAYIMV